MMRRSTPPSINRVAAACLNICGVTRPRTPAWLTRDCNRSRREVRQTQKPAGSKEVNGGAESNAHQSAHEIAKIQGKNRKRRKITHVDCFRPVILAFSALLFENKNRENRRLYQGISKDYQGNLRLFQLHCCQPTETRG